MIKISSSNLEDVGLIPTTPANSYQVVKNYEESNIVGVFKVAKQTKLLTTNNILLLEMVTLLFVKVGKRE